MTMLPLTKCARRKSNGKKNELPDLKGQLVNQYQGLICVFQEAGIGRSINKTFID